MSRQYKITYKIYPNKRLQETTFHGKGTYPIYIQITYLRRNLIFKSYYFSLFSKSKYLLKIKGKKIVPKVEDIIKMEKEILDYLVSSEKEYENVEEIVKDYYFYSLDLCSESELRFRLFLSLTFFYSKEAFALANLILKTEEYILYDVISDLSRLFKEKDYNALVNEARKQHHCYLPLYEFAQLNKNNRNIYLSILQWEREDTRRDFMSFLNEKVIIQDINKLVNELRKEHYGKSS